MLETKVLCKSTGANSPQSLVFSVPGGEREREMVAFLRAILPSKSNRPSHLALNRISPTSETNHLKLVARACVHSRVLCSDDKILPSQRCYQLMKTRNTWPKDQYKGTVENAS